MAISGAKHDRSKSVRNYLEVARRCADATSGLTVQQCRYTYTVVQSILVGSLPLFHLRMIISFSDVDKLFPFSGCDMPLPPSETLLNEV